MNVSSCLSATAMLVEDFEELKLNTQFGKTDLWLTMMQETIQLVLVKAKKA